MSSHSGHDPFDGLVLDDDFVRGAAVLESDLELVREQLRVVGVRCPDCARRAYRTHRWAGRGAFVLLAVAGLASVGSAVFASLAAGGLV